MSVNDWDSIDAWESNGIHVTSKNHQMECDTERWNEGHFLLKSARDVEQIQRVAVDGRSLRG